MAKFKIGDRIKNIYTDDIGTVDENNSTCPYIIWDYDGTRYADAEDDLELYIYPASEISKIINQSLDRENSWDDSVEISDSMDLPVDKFEFRYQDEYGRNLSHKFTQSEGDYWIEDVVAEFANFLFGVGYTREDVYKYIREDRL